MITSVIEAKKHELTDLCECHGVERLALFGSALREDSDSGKSDLDFAVEFQTMTRQSCRPEGYAV